MAYIDPVVTWSETREPSPEDLNRIEGNIKHIKSEISDFDGDKAFNEDVTVTGNTVLNGDFTADGKSTTGAGITVSTLAANGSSVSGTDFTITKPTALYGEFNTTTASSTYRGFIQAKVASTYTNDGEFGLGGAEIAYVDTVNLFRYQTSLQPGTYRLYIRANGTGAVTLSLKRFGVFGNSTV